MELLRRSPNRFNASDADIELFTTLGTISSLIRHANPRALEFLAQHQMLPSEDVNVVMFVHRWLLVDFKREFPLDAVRV